MRVSLSDHYSYKNIFRMTISPVLMMIFTSLYSVVDGYFVSNYAGLDAYAGVNLIFPVIMIVGGIGFMFGTGGSALSSKLLGEGNRDKANKVFTMMLLIVLIFGVTIGFFIFLLIKPIATALGTITNGTTQGMVDEAIKYGRLLALGQVFFMTQNLFHSYFIVDEKPKLGFFYTILAGLTNIVLDFLFIKVLQLGIIGAALATILGYIVGSVFPLIHFIRNKEGNIMLAKTKLEARPILQSAFNGSSEFVNSISSSIVGMVFNIQLLRFFGQRGVSAYGTLMYVSFMFVAIFIGYSIGMGPVVGYNYGANNKKELSNVLRKSLIIISIASIAMLIIGELLGPVFARLYIKEDQELLDLAIHAFRIYSIHFLFCGLSIYIASFFTALNNGLISAIVSFLRTLVLHIGFVLVLPIFMGGEGIWWSIIASELLTSIIAVLFLVGKRNKYGYFDSFKKSEAEVL